MNINIENKSLFDFDKTILKETFLSNDFPFDIIPKIKEEIMKIGEKLNLEEYNKFKSDIWISKRAKVAFTSIIQGPCIIGHETEIRQGAYIRGGVVIGNNCVIGNSTEVKNSIIFDNVQIPHFNYVGDSILGYKVHLGAGVIISNLRLDQEEVTIKGLNINTKLKKFGAAIGDNSQVGCNSVINPGTIICKDVTIHPLRQISGVIK